jgi:hypothetical protein
VKKVYSIKLNIIKSETVSKPDDKSKKLKCFVRGCCKETVIWSIVLNQIPPMYAKLEAGARQRVPPRKHMERLKKATADDDAHFFVDMAPQR